METRNVEKRLGKGLEALISSDAGKPKERVERAETKNVMPNPFQPRKKFSKGKMEELVNSLREKGIIQPILVRSKGEKYEIIAGERRWRAAQEIGLEEIPIIVKRDIDDANSLEISLIENIQREELNTVEEATAYKELIEKFEYTLEKVGQMMGKDKTTVSNSLRILTLSREILDLIEEGRISAGHAKALLSVQNEKKRKKVLQTILNKGLSVREAESLVKRIGEPRITAKKTKDPETAGVEEQLQHKLGTRVSIYQGKKRGRIEIQFFSNEDLERLLRMLLAAGA
ncbi:MAG: ParB/RepB/Spo0J family partition protein [Candidatus Omnitrophota bacterium]